MNTPFPERLNLTRPKSARSPVAGCVVLAGLGVGAVVLVKWAWNLTG